MPRYLARVEIQNATSSDYTRLHEYMEDVTFETSITGDNGRRFVLPSAEYFLDIELDLEAVRDLTEHAVGRTGRDYVFIVVEITAASWSLHERQDGPGSNGPAG